MALSCFSVLTTVGIKNNYIPFPTADPAVLNTWIFPDASTTWFNLPSKTNTKNFMFTDLGLSTSFYTDVTISFLIKIPVTVSKFRTIFYLTNLSSLPNAENITTMGCRVPAMFIYTSSKTDFHFRYSYNSSSTVELPNGGVDRTTSTTGSIVSDSTSLITVVFTSTKLIYYVNKTEVYRKEDHYSITPRSINTKLLIGDYFDLYGNDDTNKAQIQQFTIYDKALTPTEINAINMTPF